MCFPCHVGVHFREAYFIPTFDTYTNVLCGGFEVTVTDPHTFDPIHSALVWLQVLHDYYPKQFAWQHGATTYWIDCTLSLLFVRVS
jgi:uncharacterized protein YbbC (DUF1343 family)